MKILYITTIAGTMNFFKPLILDLLEAGNIVDIATNETISTINDFYKEHNCKIYNIDCSRSPIKQGNVKAISQIKKIVSEGGYDIVHCHTPIASACTRIACRGIRKKGLKVIYTAHGFHFYKGAPKKNWAMYYPVEKMCAKYTDSIVTITKDDYELAKNKFKSDEVIFVPGVGIDTKKFADVEIDIHEKRKELSIPDEAYTIITVGELNKNKNQKIVLDAIAKINNPNIHYVIAGDGQLFDYLVEYSKQLGVSDNVHILGHRDDIPELLHIANAYVLPSIREGLNVSIMEAMAAGLPIICGDIRGNRDMVDDSVGALFDPTDSDSVADAIISIMNSKKDYRTNNRKKAAERYDSKIINRMIMDIYEGWND